MVQQDNLKQYDLTYIVMEYVEHSLFDFCTLMGGMGEEVGKFFLNQLINTLEYIHGEGVVHRDMKLENILIDKD